MSLNKFGKLDYFLNFLRLECQTTVKVAFVQWGEEIERKSGL